jgi:hypothetical protein
MGWVLLIAGIAAAIAGFSMMGFRMESGGQYSIRKVDRLTWSSCLAPILLLAGVVLVLVGGNLLNNG